MTARPKHRLSGVPHNAEWYRTDTGTSYRPARSHWIVVAPPVGLIVPFLPPFYTTIWIGGAPYYYANDVYCARRPAQDGYVVVEPRGTDAAVSTQATTSELYVLSEEWPERRAAGR